VAEAWGLSSTPSGGSQSLRGMLDEKAALAIWGECPAPQLLCWESQCPDALGTTIHMVLGVCTQCGKIIWGWTCRGIWDVKWAFRKGGLGHGFAL